MHVTEPGSFIQIDITLIFGGALLLPGKKPEGKPFGVPSELGDYEFGGSGFSRTILPAQVSLWAGDQPGIAAADG